MSLNNDSPGKVLRMAQHALRSVGLAEENARLIPENLIGDDDPRCEGYVQLDGGIDIYPTLIGDGVGWGVSATVCIPGCRTMPNGDPGYPDEYDAVDLLEPSFQTRGLRGLHTHARRAWSAVETAVTKMVEDRLRNCLPEDYDIFAEEE
jgi:hypothetical protein